MTPSLATPIVVGLGVAGALVVVWVVAGRPRVWVWLPWVVGAVVAIGWWLLGRMARPVPPARPLERTAEDLARRTEARANTAATERAEASDAAIVADVGPPAKTREERRAQIRRLIEGAQRKDS